MSQWIFSSARKHVSFDSIAVSTVVFGCAWLFGNAIVEGRRPLQGQVRASARLLEEQGDKRVDFTPCLCRELEEKGYIVIDNFLTRQEVRNAVASVSSGRALFHTSPNEQKGDSVRTDSVLFFGNNTEISTRKERKMGDIGKNPSDVEHLAGLYRVRQALHRLAYDISKSSFSEFSEDRHLGMPCDNGDRKKQDGASGTMWLGVPSMMQVSIYNTLSTGEGSFYTAHTDTCSDKLLDMGMLGYARSLYLRRRYLTCIVYLNEDWRPANGGSLRLFPAGSNDDRPSVAERVASANVSSTSSKSTVDIEPRAGRLVIFSSAHMVHAVLPTFKRRLACSTWLTLNNEWDPCSVARE